VSADDNAVLARLDALYRIGGGDGANRPGLSAAEDEAHLLVRGWMDDAGLETEVDAAGNLYGRLVGRAAELPEVWCGSHLDSVPRGGRYDGALGVVAALQAVTGASPSRRTITVVAFRDEEGWRFGGGFLGSRAAVGDLTADWLERVDREGISVREALAACGRELDPGAGWLSRRPAAYLEAHIEQGPVLAERGAARGIVSSIVGIRDVRVSFEGREGHAGTTPMSARSDAALCAAAFQVAAAAAAREIPDAVVTVGGPVRVEPGAANVIARRAVVVVDARAPDRERLDRLHRALSDVAQRCAADHGCSFAADVLLSVAPVACAESVRAALARALPTAPELPSGAGHDAQVLAEAGVPVGMLFVRSRNGGISHSPDELSDDDDVLACVTALRRTLVDLADGEERPRACRR
jgi:hydantoinase/carbamoylase family amidase